MFSDVGVGAGFCIGFCYSGWRARIVVSLSFCSYNLINVCRVNCNSSTSVCSCITDATNLVCFIVYGGSSICSMHFALCFALSIFVFYACRISRRSTGAGGSSEVPAPRAFLALDMCGSFLALAAEPRINTNLYSSSYANYCSLASRAEASTLLECVPF